MHSYLFVNHTCVECETVLLYTCDFIMCGQFERPFDWASVQVAFTKRPCRSPVFYFEVYTLTCTWCPKNRARIFQLFIFNYFLVFLSSFAEYRPSCLGKNVLFPIANQFGDSQYEQPAHCQNDGQRIHVRIRKSVDHVGQSIFTRLDLLR